MKPTLRTALASIALIAATSNVLAGEGVTFKAASGYPEGIVYSPKDRTFMVSSLSHGVVGRVSPKGDYKAFITDAKLISTVGMLLDRRTNTLWVTNSDPGFSDRTSDATKNKLAAVAVFDASTGKPRAYHDLGKLVEGGHFANDLSMDAKGNVYVTDSFAPVIYRIDAAGRTSMFAQSDLFKGEGFNLNGIVVHPDGYLLVAKYNTGDLFRVSIKDPKQVEAVSLPEPLKGADGLVLKSGKSLVVIQNSGADSVVELSSTDGWKSAKIVSRRPTANSFPTTAAVVGKSLYVVNARLDTMLDAKAAKVDEYLLQKFDF